MPLAGRPAGTGSRGAGGAARRRRVLHRASWPGPAHEERIALAIGARRVGPLWRLLDGIAEDDWTDAIEMDGAGRGGRLPAGLVVGEHLAADPPRPPGPGQVSADPPSRAAPHPAPRPADPTYPQAGQGRCHLLLLVHPDEPGYVRAGQGRRRALVPAPHHR